MFDPRGRIGGLPVFSAPNRPGAATAMADGWPALTVGNPGLSSPPRRYPPRRGLASDGHWLRGLLLRFQDALWVLFDAGDFGLLVRPRARLLPQPPKVPVQSCIANNQIRFRHRQTSDHGEATRPGEWRRRCGRPRLGDRRQTVDTDGLVRLGDV